MDIMSPDFIAALINTGAAGIIGYVAIQRLDAMARRLDEFHTRLIDVIADKIPGHARSDSQNPRGKQ